MRMEVEIYADDLVSAVDELAKEIEETTIVEILEIWKKEEPIKYEAFCKMAQSRLKLVNNAE